MILQFSISDLYRYLCSNKFRRTNSDWIYSLSYAEFSFSFEKAEGKN